MTEQAIQGTTFHRFVTGHLENGKSTHIRKDVVKTEQLPGSTIKDPMKVVFTTDKTPADNSSPFVDPMTKTVASLANGNGTVVRYVDFIPHTVDVVMHRTNSLDYGILLEGSIFHSTEDGDEVEMKAGDIMVQRGQFEASIGSMMVKLRPKDKGTAHAWNNRSDKPAKMVFILVAAEPVQVSGQKLEEAGFTAKEFEQSAKQ